MSRCFPFPPPGYAKKTRTDYLDLLKKEKNREKKHKKEKDKGKRENKEKGEKEGRDGKHKEKKDKKEKHREKKKDRDRDKDKNDFSTPDEKVFPAQVEGLNSGKLHQKEIKQKDKKGLLFEENFSKQYTGNNGEKARESNHLAEENKDSKFLQELGRRIKDKDGGAGNQLVQRFTIADHRKDEGAVRLVAKGSSTWTDGKEKLMDKSIDARKVDGQRFWAKAQPIANAPVHNHAESFQPRVDGMPRSMEKSLGRTVETTVDGKEKVKEKKDDKQGDKGKDKEKKKKRHGKNKDRDKEKKKEKVKEQTEHKNTEQNKLKESYKGGLVGINSFAQVPRNSHDNAVNGENFKKRKDIESNGVLDANDNWPSKLPRSSSSSHPCTENGRILEPCQISIPYASDKTGAATKLKVDNKEGKINGIIEVQPSIYSNNNTTVIMPADPVAEASSKPPHPDSNYLGQVYSVPKMEEWLDVDSQEWLFGSSCSQEIKPRVKSSEARESQQVWAEALHIDSEDLCALPYVIPY